MELNYEIFHKAMAKLARKGSRESEEMNFADIHRASGVHNIGRFARGESKPTVKNWMKLHEAFPDDIPVPEMTDGTRIYKKSTHIEAGRDAHRSGRDMNISAQTEMTTAQRYLLELIEKSPDKERLVNELVGYILTKNAPK